MSTLEKVFQLTKQMETILDQPVQEKNRLSVIEAIHELLEQREKHVFTLKPPYSEKEKAIGNKIVKMNQTIEQRMNTLMSQIKLDLRQMNKHKQSNRSYINPYGNIQSIDGMFMDRKQ